MEQNYARVAVTKNVIYHAMLHICYRYHRSSMIRKQVERSGTTRRKTSPGNENLRTMEPMFHFHDLSMVPI